MNGKRAPHLGNVFQNHSQIGIESLKNSREFHIAFGDKGDSGSNGFVNQFYAINRLAKHEYREEQRLQTWHFAFVAIL